MGKLLGPGIGCTWIATRQGHQPILDIMNLEQFEPEARERIEDHLGSYKTGQLIPNEDHFEELESQCLYIKADTIKEARGIVSTARLMGHFAEFIPTCGCAHDCCGCVFTTVLKVKRIDRHSFIAIHSFAINV